MPADPGRALEGYLRALSYRTPPREPEPAPILEGTIGAAPAEEPVTRAEPDAAASPRPSPADGPRQPGLFARLRALCGRRLGPPQRARS